jgi:AGCS family alanine or glycine:cation symporter
MENMLSGISSWIWGWPLILLLTGTHLFLTFRLGFIQRHLFRAIRISFTRTREGDGEISHFGALTTALAATIGTGDIVGGATAICAGGPGAVLWMWLTGVFGIANGLMAVPNLVSLLLLSPVIVAETRLHLPGELS